MAVAWIVHAVFRQVYKKEQKELKRMADLKVKYLTRK